MSIFYHPVNRAFISSESSRNHLLIIFGARRAHWHFTSRLTYRRAFDKPLYSRLDFMFTHKLDVTSFRAPPINISDHSPLFAKIRIQIDQTKIKKSTRTKIKYNLLTEDPEIRHKYKNLLGNGLESVLETCDGTNVSAATDAVIQQINTKLKKSCGASKIRSSGKNSGSTRPLKSSLMKNAGLPSAGKIQKLPKTGNTSKK